MNHYSKLQTKWVTVLLIFVLMFNGAFSTMTVSAGGDGEPPVVHNVEVSPNDVGVGDVITVKADVTDDNSGVRNVAASFYSPSQNRIEGMSLNYDSETDSWKSKYEI